tara:strand:- start:292 stop:435 length:144 start_codon:yes stop_codon:yes gene_type:complete
MFLLVFEDAEPSLSATKLPKNVLFQKQLQQSQSKQALLAGDATVYEL